MSGIYVRHIQRREYASFATHQASSCPSVCWEALAKKNPMPDLCWACAKHWACAIQILIPHYGLRYLRLHEHQLFRHVSLNTRETLEVFSSFVLFGPGLRPEYASRGAYTRAGPEAQRMGRWG